jgi:presenilin-like A22 family membrane protease
VKIDLTLPLVLFSVTFASTLLYPRLREKFRSIMGQTQLRIRDAVTLVVVMGLVVTVIAFAPQIAILVFFSASYMLVLFTFTYAFTKRWYVAAAASGIYILAYAFFWNSVSLNFFAIALSILVSTLLGTLFSWRTAAVFACLLTAMDVVQVFGTRLMVASAEKLIALGLPVVVMIPMFPSDGRIVLGLGDIFLAGILAIQTVERYGLRTGLPSLGVSSLVFLVEEYALLNSGIGFFPATIMVTAGWLASIVTIEAKIRLKRAPSSSSQETTGKTLYH